MKKVGIIGAGNVGPALARGFIKYGYETTLSSRSEEKRRSLEREIEGLKTDTPEETARNSEIIVLAVKGSEAIASLDEIGIENLDGKLVIDTTNPIANEGPVNGVLVYSSSINKSLMEELQDKAPNAKFVKAFSCIGAAHMVDPQFDSKPTMFICGEDESSKKEVENILDQFGWETEDMGNIEAARAIEPLAILWCIPGFRQNHWNHALKLLKK